MVEFNHIVDLYGAVVVFVVCDWVPVTIAVHVEGGGGALGSLPLEHSRRRLQNGGMQFCLQHAMGTSQISPV